MKRLITMTLSAMLAITMSLGLAACGQKDAKEDAAPAAEEGAATETDDATAEVAPFATLGDVFAEDTEGMSSTIDEQRYVCAFNWGGAWWRIEADLEDGLYEKVDEAWVEDQDKVEELLSPLAVTKTDVLEAPDVETIEALAGKTGADLTAEGFTFAEGTMVVNGEETDCVATMGDFDFLVTFDGAVPDENAENVAGVVADMTVNSASIQGVTWTALEG